MSFQNHFVRASAVLASFFCTVLVSSANAQISSGTPIKILPLGDSITQGTRSLKSYRYPLWRKLIDRKIAFDFVGSLSTNFGGNPEFPSYAGRTFDLQNEGHWGWRADQIRDNLPLWQRNYSAQMTILLIGSNDIQAGESVLQITHEIEQIIDRLRSDNPQMVIFVSNLPPSTAPTRTAGHVALGREIPGLVSRKNTNSSPVRFVDVYSGFSTSYLADGVHPNAQGEELIADRVAVAISNYLREGDLASGPTQPSTGPAFVKAINFNGPAINVDGIPFLSESTAGVTVSGYRFTNQNVALSPDASSARSTMLRSSVWGTSLRVSVPLNNGTYRVYLYNWEDNNSATFQVAVENKLSSFIASGSAGTWKRLGPYDVTVNDGVLNINSSGGAFNLSGLEIYTLP